MFRIPLQTVNKTPFISLWKRNSLTKKIVLPVYTKRDIQEKVIELVLNNSSSEFHESVSLGSHLVTDVLMDTDSRVSLYFEALEEFQIPNSFSHEDFMSVKEATEWIQGKLVETGRFKE